MALETNLVSNWSFEGNSNDNKGTNNGIDTSITYNTSNGKILQGAGFNGTSSFISLANSASLQITGALTIAAWVKPSDATPSKNMIVFAKGDQNSAAGLDYTITVNQRKIRAIVSNGVSTVDFTSTTTMSDLTFHHIGMVYVPSTSLTLYLDGAQDGQTTTSIISSIQSTTHTAAIGRDGDVAQGFFGSAIDELPLWARALSAAEFTQLYNGGAGLYYNGTVFADPNPRGGSFLMNFV